MKKVFALVVSLAMVMCMLAACGGSDATVSADTIKIGLTGPLTGSNAVYGNAVAWGMEIAVEEINAAAEANGGLNVKCSDGKKRPIRFLQCGHIHKTIEIYNSSFNVFISQSGSFVRDQNYYMPFIHVKGEVTEDLRILRG